MSKNNSGSTSKKHHSRTIITRTTKRRGEIGELAFLWKAASLGFTVAKPYGDSDRYDFILDSGGQLFRVQVKAVNKLKGVGYLLTTHHDYKGVYPSYSSDEVDFLAGYLGPEDAWVLVPVGALEGRTNIYVYPREKGKYGIFANYREAWCQFACARRARRPEGLTVEFHCGGQHEQCPVRLLPRTKPPGRPRKRVIE